MTDLKRSQQPHIEPTKMQIVDGNTILDLDYEGARAAHHGDSWWGVAVGFRAMQVAAGLLSETTLWNRDALRVVSGHPGPGVRDSIDYVTGCVQRKRYHLSPEQTGQKGCSRDMKFQWWVSDGRTTAAIALPLEFVPEAFYDILDRLGTDTERDDDQRQFDAFKLELEAKIWKEPLAGIFQTTCLPVTDARKPAVLPIA